MGLNNYPYTNFHEMNLDWILEQFQKEISRIAELEAFKREAGEDIEELQRTTALLSNSITALRSAQTLLESQQEALTTLVNGYDTRITTNTNNIAGLSAWQTAANVTLEDYGERIEDLEEFCDDLASGGLPPALIEALMEYVRDNLPELLDPLEDAIDDLETAMTSVQSAVATLQSGKLNAGQGVSMEANLNSVTTAGIYAFLPVYTTVNVPEASYGTMVVQVLRDTNNDTGDLIQIAYVDVTRNGSSQIEVYYRYADYYTSPSVSYNWHAWKKIVTDTDLSPLESDISTIESSLSSMATSLEQIEKQVPSEQFSTLSALKTAIMDAGSGVVGIYGISSALNTALTGHNYSGISIAKYVASSNRIDLLVESGTNAFLTMAAINTSTDAITIVDIPLPDRTLVYKATITSSEDLNDYYSEAGVYLMSSIATNSPSDAQTYTTLVVFKTPTSSDTTQMLIHGTSGRIWLRRYHGTPLAWDPWLEITTSNAVKIFYSGSISSLSTWGSMARNSASVLTGNIPGSYTTNGITLPAGVYRVSVSASFPAKSSGWYGVALSEAGSESPFTSSGIVQTNAGFSAVVNRLSASGIIKVSSNSEYRLLFGSNQQSLTGVSGYLYIERLD